MTGTWGAPKLPSGLDQFTAKQLPDVRPVDDLSRFVMDRIREAENEPRIDGVPGIHYETHGAMVHRYASKVREDMAAFRRIVAAYCETSVSEGVPMAAIAAYRVAVKAIAMRWSSHADFRDEWRLA